MLLCLSSLGRLLADALQSAYIKLFPYPTSKLDKNADNDGNYSKYDFEAIPSSVITTSTASPTKTGDENSAKIPESNQNTKSIMKNNRQSYQYHPLNHNQNALSTDFINDFYSAPNAAEDDDEDNGGKLSAEGNYVMKNKHCKHHKHHHHNHLGEDL